MSGFGFKVSTYKGGIAHSNIDIIKLSSIKSSFLEQPRICKIKRGPAVPAISGFSSSVIQSQSPATGQQPQ